MGQIWKFLKKLAQLDKNSTFFKLLSLSNMTLLSTFEKSDECKVSFKRDDVITVDKSNQFIMPFHKREYQKQYFHVYSQRLEALRERIASNVRKELGDQAEIKRLSDLDNIQDGKNVVVIGTLFKTQILKPNILKEVGEENAITNEEVAEKPILDKHIDSTDELVLEDELQRARLHFTEEDTDLKVGQFVTGIVCGILGCMNKNESTDGGGKFRVKKVFMPDFPPQIARKSLTWASEPKIAFMSGIELSGSTSAKCLGALELASSWIVGEAGDVTDQEQNSKIIKLVIAGNSLSAETRDKKALSTAKYLTSGQEALSVNAVNVFDGILQEFSSGIDVDLMPGENDPANQIMPQQPLHCCLFPKARKFKTLKTVPNPYMFEACGVTILGTSGQNLEDIMKNSNISDPLEALECLVRWSHLAPTCPDTLGCFPFDGKDPFVMETLPHVLFVGNQPKFAQKTLKLDDKKEILLVTLPKFSSTSTIILLNLQSLHCQPLVFSHF